MQRSGTGVDVDSQGKDLTSSTADVRNFKKGMKLKEGLEALHFLPGEVDTQVMVRKLKVLRLAADGDEEIAYEDIESGKYVPSGDESYGVLAQLFCSSRRTAAPATVWQVYANNALVAWDTTDFRQNCATATNCCSRHACSRGLGESRDRAYRQGFSIVACDEN